MTVGGSAESVEARLAAGRLRGPCCGGVLARWGWARRRVVAMFAGAEEFRPRRGRGRRCGRAPVLRPAVVWARRGGGGAGGMAGGGGGRRGVAARAWRAPGGARGGRAGARGGWRG